ncbi:hypothetical protein ACCAA_1120008 [Candidatus Accumulibacter aalborgensis]|uniref:Uncharacterized protein n=1 Tax=Candidatus Accumulibacter aalborgensis TaxID=1860102 RepID=A0A1A8XHA3_9PROT|nr:hypothetical protein ACCAA_1120008 [Candidatus Accumulibacter aalborgensis]
MQEPFGVDLLCFARSHHLGQSTIDNFLERRVILAQHAAVRFERLRRADDDPVAGFLGFGHFAVEQGVIHHEGNSSAGFQGQERFTVVLRADDVHLHLLFFVHLAQQAFGSGPGGGHHILAGEIRKIVDPGRRLGHQTSSDDEDGIRETDLLLSLNVVGRRTTFEVDRAILDQRDAIRRGDRHQLDVELGEFQFSLDGIDRLEHHFLRVADDLLLVIIIRERDRRLAMPQGNDSRLLDLLQGTGQLLRQNRRRRQGGGQHGSQGYALAILDHCVSSSSVRRMAGRLPDRAIVARLAPRAKHDPVIKRYSIDSTGMPSAFLSFRDRELYGLDRLDGCFGHPAYSDTAHAVQFRELPEFLESPDTTHRARHDACRHPLQHPPQQSRSASL